MTQENLIYDIGAHNGNDTEKYLKRGYNVIAVEANPYLYNELKVKFANEIKEGRLIVLNFAITETNNEKTVFYVSKDDWRSSVVKEILERETCIIETIELTTRNLVSLFDQYGSPYYCKIDIEGYDDKVVNSISKYEYLPTYISRENSCRSIKEINENEECLYDSLNALCSCGYSKFKLVDQDDFVTLSDRSHYAFLHRLSTRLIVRLGISLRLLRADYNVRSLSSKRNQSKNANNIPVFTEEFRGKWHNYTTTKTLLAYHFREYFYYSRNKEFIFWVDIYATK